MTRVILVHCLSTEQETVRGNTEMIYGVDEVRVNLPLHIRIYSVDLNRAPRDDHFCPSSSRPRPGYKTVTNARNQNGDVCKNDHPFSQLWIDFCRLQSIALAHRSEYIPYCLCKTFINITVTFVKITVTINFVAVLVYDPKIFGPCSIHAQKFKDRGPDFGLLFTERYDYPWLFDRFKDEDGTCPVWIWKIGIIIPIYTFSIITERDCSWSYHVTYQVIDTKRVNDLSANPRWVTSVHEKTNRTKTLEMVLCENFRPSVNFPTL